MLDVLFAGELNVDVIMSGVRQAPAFGREILCTGYQELPGSSTGNCACAAATLGLRAAIFSRLGTDRFGEIMFAALERCGLDLRFLERSDAIRTGVTVSLSSEKDRAMATFMGDTIDAFDAEAIPVEAANARHLHVGSFFLQPRVRKNLPQAFRRARALHMTTSLDAGWDERERWHDALDGILPLTDYFFPNESEACAIAGTADPEAAAVYLAGCGCNAVVKLGGDGSLYCARGERVPRHYAPFPTFVRDTTGAGDSFNAGFLYARLNGMSIDACMRYGNANGALAVQRAGGADSCPTLDELRRTLARGTALPAE